MLEWRGNHLWYGAYLLVDLECRGWHDVRLDLRGWGGWGVSDYSYADVREGKQAAEAWARSMGMALADVHARYADDPVTDDDIPF